jgi:sugar phosphate isomerase/epimerase
MRLGASLRPPGDDPDDIARAFASQGYAAAVCPRVTLDQPERINALRAAFARHDVVLAEVGVWNNMLDPDPAKRLANLEANIHGLAVADEVGALCCVNIAGSFNPTKWDGPHPNNLGAEAFTLTVDNVRRIIDAVKPKRARYTIECMPYTIPDSPDSYLRLIRAIDRPAFGVHLDPVNMINCPQRYYYNADFLRECFAKLGPWIVSCHGKDILLQERLTTHLDEVRPGLGKLDYRVYLQQLSRLPQDTPLILEHLPQEEYAVARDYVVHRAVEIGLLFHQTQEDVK